MIPRNSQLECLSKLSCHAADLQRFGRIDSSQSPRLPRVAFNRQFGALITQALCAERGKPDWRRSATADSGPLALATRYAQVPERYARASNFNSRVAHPWSWDIGPSTIAAQTSLNMVHSHRKARPFGVRTKFGLQENGRLSQMGRALLPGSLPTEGEQNRLLPFFVTQTRVGSSRQRSQGGLVHLVNGCRGDAEFRGDRGDRVAGDALVYPTVGGEVWADVALVVSLNFITGQPAEE